MVRPSRPQIGWRHSSAADDPEVAAETRPWAGATGVRLGHRPQHSDRVHLGCDNAPRNIFSLTGFVLKILKFIAHSPTRAIEHLQDNKNRAIRLLSGFHCIALIGLWLSLASTEIEIINFEP